MNSKLVGIEAINVYGGGTVLDVRTMALARSLDMERFDNLLIKEKTVSMHYEDPVSFAVNAAFPIINRMSEVDKEKIELIIVASESGFDFGKSMSTYVHDYLKLPRSVRSFEIKQACYGGTAALQMAINFILSETSPDAKALVLCTDVARPRPNTYAEPTQGAASVAMLVSSNPLVFQFDIGANGYWSYEVMDTWRPTPDHETGDPDLSLLSYLDCAEHSFKQYMKKAPHTDFQESFDFLAFHTPFAGLVKGVHRTMMRKFKKVPPNLIEDDFKNRVQPSFKYCQKVGNIYSGTVFLALIGLISSSQGISGKRVGIFSYGSGCSSEFYSGKFGVAASSTLENFLIHEELSKRHVLSMNEYEDLLKLNHEVLVEIENKVFDHTKLAHIYDFFFKGRHKLVLNRISNYHREYVWT